MRRRSTFIAAAAAAALLVGGCGSATESPAPAASSSAYASIIDVRTPAEFAAGHVVGAQNIDVQSAGFGQAVAALPKPGPYLVYCRSGSRSAQAATTMRNAGLTVADGGGLADMEKLGYPFGR
ncbi:MAG: rhodanese-like domain-containing protein [Kineosporiaceae bacterium]